MTDILLQTPYVRVVTHPPLPRLTFNSSIGIHTEI